jgi:hypothetical protein
MRFLGGSPLPRSEALELGGDGRGHQGDSDCVDEGAAAWGAAGGVGPGGEDVEDVLLALGTEAVVGEQRGEEVLAHLEEGGGLGNGLEVFENEEAAGLFDTRQTAL